MGEKARMRATGYVGWFCEMLKLSTRVGAIRPGRVLMNGIAAWAAVAAMSWSVELLLQRCLSAGLAAGTVLRAQAQENAAIGTFRGVGVVAEIDSGKNALTISHEEIKGLMPAMVMMYRVDPPSLIGGLKQGDKIEFLIDAKRFTITDVKLLSR